jgi:hypothetical protein
MMLFNSIIGNYGLNRRWLFYIYQGLYFYFLISGSGRLFVGHSLGIELVFAICMQCQLSHKMG